MKTILKFVVCSLFTLAAFAQIEDGVPPGFDTWHTPADGGTYYKLANEPIPAGFFCDDSQAFTGTLDFEGVPIKTFPAGALGKTDTIIERMDFAPYDENGLTYSRLVARALSLKAQAIENECGTWDVTATLAKNQPVTQISYVRDGGNSGFFNADLVLNFRMIFTLRGDEQVQRELVRTVHFSKFVEIPYTVEYLPEGALTDAKRALSNRISFDTDGDGTPDSFLNMTGQQGHLSKALQQPTSAMFVSVVGTQTCHTGPEHQHCVETSLISAISRVE